MPLLGVLCISVIFLLDADPRWGPQRAAYFAQVLGLTFAISAAATVVVPLAVFSVGCSVNWRIQHRAWLKGAWLVNIPWVTAAVAYAATKFAVLLFPATETRHTYPGPVERLIPGLVWSMVCVAALAWWSSISITWLQRSGIITFANFRDHAVWTVAAAAAWAASTIYGIVIGEEALRLIWLLLPLW